MERVKVFTLLLVVLLVDVANDLSPTHTHMQEERAGEAEERETCAVQGRPSEWYIIVPLHTHVTVY